MQWIELLLTIDSNYILVGLIVVFYAVEQFFTTEFRFDKRPHHFFYNFVLLLAFMLANFFWATTTVFAIDWLNADAAIEWNEAENFPYADRNLYIGPEDVASGVFGRIAADWDYRTLSDLAYYETTGDQVIVTGRYNAKIQANKKVIRAQFTHVWTLADNKAIRFQQYTDTMQGPVL